MDCIPLTCFYMYAHLAFMSEKVNTMRTTVGLNYPSQWK